MKTKEYKMKFETIKHNFPKSNALTAKWKSKNYHVEESDEFYFCIEAEKITFYYQHKGEEYLLATIEFNQSLYLLSDEYYGELTKLEETEFKVETMLKVNHVVDVDAIFEKMVNILKLIPEV